MSRGLRRHLDDLAQGRRPRPFRADPQDAAEVRAAIELRAARTEDPDPDFVAGLHRRLAAGLAGAAAPAPVPGRPPVGVGRRGLLVGGAAVAAASAVAGAGLDRVLGGRGDGAGTLTPTHGEWRTVAAADELPEGAVRAFDLGTVAGFVQRAGGVPVAVSGSCTHQGCRLRLAGRRLDCPCHTTSFAPTGELLAHELPVAPPPLPRFATREVDGEVQVLAPPSV